MKKTKKPILIVFRESLWQSIVTQVTDIGFLLGSAWFNYHFIDNSKMVNFIIFIGFFLIITAQSNGKTKRFYTKADIKKYLESHL